MSSFLGLSAARSRRNRSSSPDRNVDATAGILAELRVLEREEEDDSYSLLEGSSVGTSVHRDIPVRSARDMQPRSAAAGSGGNGGEFSFISPLRHGSSRLIQSGGGLMSAGQGQGIGLHHFFLHLHPPMTTFCSIQWVRHQYVSLQYRHHHHPTYI